MTNGTGIWFLNMMWFLPSVGIFIFVEFLLIPKQCFIRFVFLVRSCYFSGEPKQKQGRGLVDHKLVQAPQ